MGSLVSCCGRGDTVNINGRQLIVRKQLGEGGFSIVYLVEDEATGRRFAMKRVFCHEEEELRQALREVELYRLFDHPNIIRVVDSCTFPSPRGDADEVLILLPLYKRGTLQAQIDEMAKNGTFFTEHELLTLFHGICLGLRELHHFRPANKDTHPGLAHRDLKPGNILLSGDYTPVLMDFGSVGKARVVVRNRSEALALQDLAAERFSMPYRAPELFDVPSDSIIDDRIDIWSLGCTLYCMAYHRSPFEGSANEAGGSIALAVINGNVQYPANDRYSNVVRSLIMYMLVTDMERRPRINDVIERLESHPNLH